MDIKKLVLGIHDLNPYGGQERSNLEIYRRLNEHFPIELHSYTFEDPRPWPRLNHVPYSNSWSNPVLLKINHFHLQSLVNLQKKYPIMSSRRNNGILIQSTGTAFPYADVVQVQFIHKSWHAVESQLDPSLVAPESLLRSGYSKAFNACNLLHEKLIYTNSKKYVAISHAIKKELMAEYGINADNITVIYHGVNAEDFRSAHTEESQAKRKEVRAKHGIPDDAMVLLTVGALNTRKGLHIVLETLRELVSHGFTDVHLLAVGAGATAQFMDKASQWGIAKHIHLVSAQKDIAPYYQAADAFFFPTLYEPFGLVILEAMASGIPVLTSTVAGAAELITPGIDGIVFDPQADITEIASEVTSLIKDKNKMKALGIRAHQSAQKHDWNSVAGQYLDFYKSL